MQFDVKIDIDLNILDILEENIDKLKNGLKDVVEYLGIQTQKLWVENAGIALKNPGNYVQHIQRGELAPYETDGWSVIVRNDHPFVILLENGYDPFDMKKVLSTSSKAMPGKHGRYLIIPMKTTPMRMAAAGIDKEEYQSLSPSYWLTRGQKNVQHQYKFGEKLTDMGGIGKPRDTAGNQRKYFTALKAPSSKFPNKTNRLAMGFSGSNFQGATTISASWKNSPFENVYRFALPGNTKTHEYGSFRTMSEKSDPNSWIHPGLRASHMAQKTAEEVGRMASESASKLIDSLKI